MCENKAATAYHLYQPAQYTIDGARWYSFIPDAIQASQIRTWDLAAMLGIISFGYPTGDRTIFNEIRRSPWLAAINQSGQIHDSPIPTHDSLWMSKKRIALRLLELLLAEATQACKGKERIFVLLSGGLDSRIIAGVIATLYRTGQITTKPSTVTWGIVNSRDVVYAEQVAKILDLDWQRINLQPIDLLHNTEITAKNMGCSFYPSHLHGMKWFRNVNSDTLVLAGSYGDSVGRAEFSSRHILELESHYPTDSWNLLRSEAFQQGLLGIQEDKDALLLRAGSRWAYARNEIEQQAWYMRNLIAQAMGFIGQYCAIYQMFTSPSVYEYMWLIHPALRTNAIYPIILEELYPSLARIPWARTNKALSGKTVGSQKRLSPQYHHYAIWLREMLLEQRIDFLDPDWYEALGFFQPDAIQKLNEAAVDSSRDESAYGLWLWLHSLRLMSDHFGKIKTSPDHNYESHISVVLRSLTSVQILKKKFRKFPAIHRIGKAVRLNFRRFASVKQIPPKSGYSKKVGY